MYVHEKTMFEIYREEGYGRRFRVVYFTELDDHNKESEISRALAGESFHHGFVEDALKEDAKRIIAEFVDRLNAGEQRGSEDLVRDLTRLRS